MLGYLKRRLSSGDLQGEAADQRDQEGLPGFLNPFNTQQNKTNPPTNNIQNKLPQRPTSTEPNMNYTGVTQKPKATYPSAPTSPTKSSIGFSAAPMVESITGQISNTITRGFFAATAKPTANKGKCKTVLILDEPHTDWSKYFRGRKIFGDWELRIEQAQFNEINMVVFSEYGCTVDVQVDKSGTKTMRSFKPDFVVIRQSTIDADEDWKDFIMGLLYGGVPSLNSLHAIFNMHDRPWMYSHLMLVRNRLGRENFPLIEQAYYPNYKEMIVPTKFPMVIKIGNCRNGKGKIKVDNHFDFQDVASIVAVSKTFATSEPFIDAKCDVIIQKIGNNFKAFLRKSLSGSWKTNTGSAILEQVPMNEKFKMWIAEVAKLFGGLDICSLKAIQSKNDEYHIYEVKGSNMNLLGESQEEDRKLISELIMSKVQLLCRPNIPKAESLHTMNRQNETPVNAIPPSSSTSTGYIGSTSAQGTGRIPPQMSMSSASHDFTHSNTISGSNALSSINAGLRNQNISESTTRPYIGQNQGTASSYSVVSGSSGSAGGYGSTDVIRSVDTQPPITTSPSMTLQSQQSMSSGQSMGHNRMPSNPNRPNIPPRQTSLKSNSGVDDGEDTMKNLRKTFAGIFGDM